MKLIIDIDEDYYKSIWENGYIYDEDNEDIAKIIKDGTPLPKIHGDIVDIETLIDMFWDGDSMEITKYDLPTIKPIIEANKVESEM